MQTVALYVTISIIIYIIFLAARKPSAFKIKGKHIPYFIGKGVISLIVIKTQNKCQHFEIT